jgi:fatty acid desaturase
VEAVTSKLHKDLILFLGKDIVRELHKPNFFFDAAAMIIMPALFFLVFYLLSITASWILWIALLFLQGFILQAFFLLSHEMFIHRGVGGIRFSYIASLIAMVPLITSPTAYKEVHFRHHYFLNTEKDSEVITLRKFPDNLFIRILCNTFFGALLGHFYLVQARTNINLKRKLGFESAILLFWVILCGSLAFVWPPIISGYIIPLLVTLPIINAFRAIIEHADSDPFHPETGQIATFYKTNSFTRLLFFYDSGDCHVIHHIFDCIPFYHMSKALELIKPYLLKNGINEQDSLLKLLYGYYIKVIPHRTPWKGKV